MAQDLELNSDFAKSYEKMPSPGYSARYVETAHDQKCSHSPIGTTRSNPAQMTPLRQSSANNSRNELLNKSRESVPINPSSTILSRENTHLNEISRNSSGSALRRNTSREISRAHTPSRTKQSNLHVTCIIRKQEPDRTVQRSTSATRLKE